MKVAFLGPLGTFSHAAVIASDRFQATKPQLLPCRSEREAILAVADGKADLALLPVENTIEGGVNATIDTLVRDAAELRVVGEELLPITQALMAPPGVPREQIRTVISHPQALAQSRQTIAQLLPDARLLAAESTADGIRRAASEDATGAIGPAAAAALYGCVILESSVEDEPGNITRFWWLRAADDAVDQSALRSGRSRTSLVFAGDGDARAGWLLGCLAEFADRSINLTRIESRPSRERLGHYYFLIDADGHCGQPTLDAALAALDQHCSMIRVLGSYPAAQSVER